MIPAFPNRKNIIFASILLLGLAILFQLFPPVGLIEKNTSKHSVMDEMSSSRMTPEYTRTLNKLVMSLSHKDFSLELQQTIIEHLPGYTEIIILTPLDHLDWVKNKIQSSTYGDRVTLIPYETPVLEETSYYLLFPEKEKLQRGDSVNRQVPGVLGTVWAQDLFEVTRNSIGRPLILTSAVHKYYFSPKGNNGQVNRDNAYLRNLKTEDFNVQTVPLAFKGGNILFDELNGKKILFCGGDVLNTTRTVWQATNDKVLSDVQIIKMIKEIFNVDSVIMLGSEKIQPSLMYHLDQAILTLPGGLIGVARIVRDGKTERMDKDVLAVERFLASARNELVGLGYKVIDIKMSVGNLKKYQHYVNSIPYVDKITGEKTILMPVFPAGQNDFDLKLVADNTRTFQEIGYRVVPVPTKANKLKGGIHCLVNVLE